MERRTTRCSDIVGEAEALKDAGVRLVVVAQGKAEPTRIPIRDSAGTLTEYKRTPKAPWC